MTVRADAAATAPARSYHETLGMLSGAFLAMTLAALDQAIVMPALPAIAHDLRGLDRLARIVVAYLMTSTTMTLVYGKISDMYGRGKVFLIAIALFVGASALCALAGDMLQLVIARGLQGMGAVSVPGGTGKEQLLSLPYIGAHATLGALSSAGAAVLVAGLERAFHAVFLIGAGVAAIAVLLSAQIRGEALKAARA